MLFQCSLSCKFPASSIFSSAGWRWRYPMGARSRFRWKLHPSSQAWPLLSTSNRGETAIAKCGNWLRRVIWGRILRGRHHGTRLWNSVIWGRQGHVIWRLQRDVNQGLEFRFSGVPLSIDQLFNFGIFEHKWGTRKHIDDLKKYSWCIPVQKEIKPIIWGAAITPEPWNRQQCWFIFEDPNVGVARLFETSRQ